MTPSGIEPATFRFVVLCLNHYATVRPFIRKVPQLNIGRKASYSFRPYRGFSHNFQENLLKWLIKNRSVHSQCFSNHLITNYPAIRAIN